MHYFKTFNLSIIRKWVFKAIYLLGIGHLLYQLNKSLYRIPIILFHKVDIENDKYWASLHPEQFDAIIQFLKTKYRLIPVEELFTSSKEKLKDTAVIVFDDAYQNFYDYAFPILEKNKVPATVFVPVKCILDNDAVWTSQIDACFKHTNKEDLQLSIAGKEYHFSFRTESEKIKTSFFLQKLLQEISTHEQLTKVEEIKKKLEYYKEKDLTMMNWDMMKELKNEIDFQSHSMTHACLDKINNEGELIYELKESQSILSNKINSKVDYIAYPIGKYSPHVEEVTSRFYKAAFAVDNRLVNLNKLHEKSYRYKIPRYNIYDTSPYEVFLRINGFHKLFGR